VSASDRDALVDLARRSAHRAGDLLLDHFHGPSSGVESKSTRTDLVSDADRAAERAIVEAIAAERPDDAIVAEEGGGRAGTSGVRWLVDPLDGTTNFLWRVPQWAVSIAARDEHGPLVAVVYDPPRGETFSASRAGGARNGSGPLRVRSEASLGEALIGTGFNYSADERARQADRLMRMLPQLRDLRRCGSAALDLAWVAAGRLDAFFETGLAPWDWAAGELLIREAGGEVEVLPARDGSPECVIGSSRALMPALRSLVSAAYR
jgi:myo-inositol-1(or 4)-monophosphatase